MARKKRRLRMGRRQRAALASPKGARGGARKRRGARAGEKRPRYAASFRQEVAEHSILHGIHAAAKKFGVSAPSVTTWRKALGINRATKKAAQAGRKITLAPAPAAAGREGRGYSADFRREVAEYSILNGIQSAAKQFKVSSPSVTNWRKALGITRRSKQKALASVSSGGGAAPQLAAADKRQLKKQLDLFVRAFERLIARL